MWHELLVLDLLYSHIPHGLLFDVGLCGGISLLVSLVGGSVDPILPAVSCNYFCVLFSPRYIGRGCVCRDGSKEVDLIHIASSNGAMFS